MKSLAYPLPRFIARALRPLSLCGVLLQLVAVGGCAESAVRAKRGPDAGTSGTDDPSGDGDGSFGDGDGDVEGGDVTPDGVITVTGGADGGLLGSLGDLGGLFGDGTIPDGGVQPDAGMCKDMVCFDVFDCYIFHPEATDCGFTACEGFICK